MKSQIIQEQPGRDEATDPIHSVWKHELRNPKGKNESHEPVPEIIAPRFGFGRKRLLNYRLQVT